MHARLMCRLILYIHGYNGVTCVDRNVPVGQWLVGSSTWSEFDGLVLHAYGYGKSVLVEWSCWTHHIHELDLFGRNKYVVLHECEFDGSSMDVW